MSTTINHGQLAKVDENGNIDVFYPKTFSKDVYVNDEKTTLETFLGTTSISTIGDGTISGAISALNSSVSLKQSITDNTLQTDAKTIVGGINEVNNKCDSSLKKYHPVVDGYVTISRATDPYVIFKETNFSQDATYGLHSHGNGDNFGLIDIQANVHRYNYNKTTTTHSFTGIVRNDAQMIAAGDVFAANGAQSVGDLYGKVGSVQSSVSSLSNTVSGLSTSVSNLSNVVSGLSGRAVNTNFAYLGNFQTNYVTFSGYSTYILEVWYSGYVATQIVTAGMFTPGGDRHVSIAFGGINDLWPYRFIQGGCVLGINGNGSSVINAVVNYARFDNTDVTAGVYVQVFGLISTLS